MSLPDEALVVRGGQNLPESLIQGSGVALVDGRLQDVSVNSALGLTLAQLTGPDPQTGYPGIPHNRVGVTTVGAVRAAGGDVTPDATGSDPHHAILSGLTPEQASTLFRPTVKNPRFRD